MRAAARERAQRPQQGEQRDRGDEHAERRDDVQRQRREDQHQQRHQPAEQRRRLDRPLRRLAGLAGRDLLQVALVVARLGVPGGGGEGGEQLAAQPRLHVGADPRRRVGDDPDQSQAQQRDAERQAEQRVERGRAVDGAEVDRDAGGAGDERRRDLGDDGEDHRLREAGRHRADRQRREQAVAVAEQLSYLRPAHLSSTAIAACQASAWLRPVGLAAELAVESEVGGGALVDRVELGRQPRPGGAHGGVGGERQRLGRGRGEAGLALVARP